MAAQEHSLADMFLGLLPQAGVTLAQMLGPDIEFAPVVRLDAAAVPPAAGFGVTLQISGDLNGKLLLFLEQGSCQWLFERLLGQQVDLPLSQMARSVLEETGNILASALLTALDTCHSVNCQLQPPLLREGGWADLLGCELSDCPDDKCISGVLRPHDAAAQICLLVCLHLN